MWRKIFFLSVSPFLLSQCATKFYEVECGPLLTCINVIDQNGTSETISNRERLLKYESLDFLQPQPYQKVLRIYSRDECGNLPSYITSYYPNGTPHQYLEVVNGRAKGQYSEWFEDGTLKISALVVGGASDLTQTAQETWLFDGLNCAWDEEGRKQAELEYSKGALHGTSLYYHPNGVVWKTVPFVRGKIEGVVKVHLENGDLFQTVTYAQGIKNGPAVRHWSDCQIASTEIFCNGLLNSGVYFDRDGKKIGEIVNGSGTRALFGKEAVTETQEYKGGVQEGEVCVYSKTGLIAQKYNSKNGCKHGEEYWYYDKTLEGQRPKLLLSWYEGKIQGIAKTWYPNGNQESQREMSGNGKSGLSIAWYEDGSLMLVEEYEKDQLQKGEYYKKGDYIPVSQVADGRGTATLFDADGSFIRKIEYSRGVPEES